MKVVVSNSDGTSTTYRSVTVIKQDGGAIHIYFEGSGQANMQKQHPHSKIVSLLVTQE